MRKKKLTLSEETLRVLNAGEARYAVGGSEATCDENPCETTETGPGETCRDTCGWTCGTSVYACSGNPPTCIDCTAGDCTVQC